MYNNLHLYSYPWKTI